MFSLNQLKPYYRRQSTRLFTDRPVARKTIEAVLQAANHAPSWENSQPWRVYLALGDTAKAIRMHHTKATQAQQKSWTEVTPPLAWQKAAEVNIKHWQTTAAAFFDEAESKAFHQMGQMLYRAPALVYLTIPRESSAYSAYDAGAFGYGILLAAAEAGLGAIPAYEIIRYPEEVRAHFEIGDDETLLMGIALGYPAESKINELKTDRRALNDFLQVKE
ncbi:nitroreductase family protein [Lacticaseibacillus parahuelsenbergensis]|uniref:Nitroreductase family protein n=1 Tax=Lacticaseibacillus parahuelsenbergensis TaxID=3068305 RepID=A0ABY9L424_9LACO|nr:MULTISPECIES: nitroreductase family protein [Lacticaseibacillus]MDE3281533.1 nitroreductase family protein [Lacticaseibacillus casei]WLV78449.1 nitroreductase family protein [Lacticaseibacillus sp. NCIMB 15471]